MFLKIIKKIKLYFRTTGFKLSFWYTAVFLAGSFFVLWLSYFLLSTSLKKESKNSIIIELNKLEKEYNEDKIKDFAEEMQTNDINMPFYVRVLSEKGKNIFIFSSDIYKNFSPPIPELLPKNTKKWSFVKSKNNKDVLEILSSRTLDGVIIQVGKSTIWRNKFLKRFWNTVFIVMFPTLILSIIIGTFLTNRTLKPLRYFIETIKDIEKGNMKKRVSIRGTGDELDTMGLLFNRMLDKISNLVSGMHNVLDNVAHDLKTPLTRLKVVAENALVENNSVEKQREALSDCLEESERVLTLLNALMDISEAEVGMMKLNKENILLSVIVEQTREIYCYTAEIKKINILLTIKNDLNIFADKARLTQALANLLDNAIKYSPSGSDIIISIEKENNYAVLRVSDNGIGISNKDIPHIWDRLYRGETTNNERGLGLGLSVVMAVAKAHNGYASVVSESGKGSIFSIFIPIV